MLVGRNVEGPLATSVEAIVISRSVKQSDTLEMPQEKSRRFRIASQQTSVP